MGSKNNIMLGTALAMMGSMLPGPTIGDLPGNPVLSGRRPVRRKPPRKFGEPAGPPLRPITYKPGELTSLRHDQVERRRKQRKKANSLKFKPYHKRKELCNS